ncbi:MAG: hypothetical protein WCI50_08385 [Actinomycetes bacterium]
MRADVVPEPVSDPEVALVLTADAWVQRFHRYCVDHGGARVRTVVVDPSAALHDDYDVLVVSEHWPPLTDQLVEALRGRGHRVVTVSGAPDPADLVARVRGEPPPTTGGPADGATTACADPAGPHRPPVTARRAAPRSTPRHQGSTATGRAAVWAVGGPGGTGVTEVALGLAATATRAGRRVALLDLAAGSPGLAPRLGLPVTPNLLTALDAVVFSDDAVFGALFDLGPGWPVVLGGSASPVAPAAWAGLGRVLDALSTRTDLVVCDVGAVIDGLADRLTLVVAVGSGTPGGAVRLIDWIGVHGPATPVTAVVNRAPGHRNRRERLDAEIGAAVGVASGGRSGGGSGGVAVRFLPTDPRVDDAAWSATLTARGPFTRALGGLWRDLATTLPAPGVVA